MNNSTETHPRQTRPEPAEAPLRLSSEGLFGAQREVLIVHNGREYCLRLTRNDKLILTA
jgi:hemin uptake protein HemP